MVGELVLTVALVTLLAAGIGLAAGTAALLVQSSKRSLILMLNLSDWVSEYLYVLILALVVDVGVSMVLFRGTSVSRLARGYSAATTICLALVVALATAATTAGVIEILEVLPPRS